MKIQMKGFGYEEKREINENTQMKDLKARIKELTNIFEDNIELIYKDIVIKNEDIGKIIERNKEDIIEARLIKEEMNVGIEINGIKEIIEISGKDSIRNIKEMMRSKYGEIEIYKKEKQRTERMKDGIKIYNIDILGLIIGRIEFIGSVKRRIQIGVYGYKYWYVVDDKMKIGELKKSICDDFQMKMEEIVVVWNGKIVSSAERIEEQEGNEIEIKKAIMEGDELKIKNIKDSSDFVIHLNFKTSILNLLKIINFIYGYGVESMILHYNGNVLMPNMTIESIPFVNNVFISLDLI